MGKIGDPEGLRMTRTGLESARRWYPRAELILSTWESFARSEYLQDLSFDRLVTAADPGSGKRQDDPPRLHNVNRIIRGTQAGLAVATGVKAMKVRTDIRFIHGNAIDLGRSFTRADKSYQVLRARVLVSQMTTLNPRRILRIPYHVCDWFFYGWKEDLVNIFDISPFEEPLFTRWYDCNPRPATDIDPKNFSRYMSEDYIWSTFLKKYRPISHEYYSQCDSCIIEESERYLVNNAIVYGNSALGIQSQKYPRRVASDLYRCYTHYEWRQLYHSYCGGEPPRGYDWEGVGNCVAFNLRRALRPAWRTVRGVSLRLRSSSKSA